MKYAIAIDFGSTFTKLVIIDLNEKKVIHSDKMPSTVGSDAAVGMNQCFDIAKNKIGKDEFEKAMKLASSSAAGGLRMAVIGLTKSLSLMAGEAAALGAGAKVVANYMGNLTEENIHTLEESKAEILLFGGGYEHGNRTMVMHNAKMIAESAIRIPIIYCGNSDVASDVRILMLSRKKQCFIVENMIPKLGEKNVEPVQEVIRNLFLQRITDMKGFDRVKKAFDNEFTPTPKAVLDAGELLSKGTEKQNGMGQLMIIDIGGATTDVYSMNSNKSYLGAKLTGLEEPYEKRTVEGDLGMRESSESVITDKYLPEAELRSGMTREEIKQSIEHRMREHDFLPNTDAEQKLDNCIAAVAIRQATRRHAGYVRKSYTAGYNMFQVGKNLTDITTIIGTGGIIVFNQDAAALLKEVEKKETDVNILMPEKVSPYLDTEYVLFVAGLLREKDEETALSIMKNSLKRCE
jgi:hypothetical protein